jgi:cellulose synthase/poly-beta-1,6-N-acetylglucosamine synthase-like glycosyltransferase
MTWWIPIAGAAVAWVAFAYLGYPLALRMLARLSPRPVARGDIAPDVSVIIAVHNGARELQKKLESTLALECPGRLEVIVASDGSTDGSDAIAESMTDRGVRLVRNDERLGKEAVQAAAIEQAHGEILVFTDVQQRGPRGIPGRGRGLRPARDGAAAAGVRSLDAGRSLGILLRGPTLALHALASRPRQ